MLQPFSGLNICPKDLAELPEDLIITLAKYLDYGDLSACSAVNHRWDQAFNVNSVWKRVCSFHPEYFSKQTCKTDSLIVDTSSGFCKRKQLAANERFVGSNVLKGNYAVSKVELGLIYCDTEFDSVDSSGNHWLFLSCTYNNSFDRPHMIQTWNLNDDPILHSTVETPLKGRMLDSMMQLATDKLFYVTPTHVLIYTFDHPRFELKLLCLINTEVPGIPRHIPKAYGTVLADDTHVIVSFLYTSYHISHDLAPFFQVWDNNGNCVCKSYDDVSFVSKLQSTYLSVSPVLQITSNGKNKILVAYNYVDGDRKCWDLVIFDVNNLSFGEFHLRIKYLLESDMIGNIVWIVHSEDNGTTTLFAKCYDIDGRTVFETKVGKAGFVLFRFIEVEGNVLLAIMDVDSQIFLLYDVLKQKEITRHTLEIKCQVFDMILASNYLSLVKYLKGKTVTYEVWNFKDGTKLYTLNVLSELDEGQGLDIICINNVSFPPKIIAYGDPMSCYPKVGQEGKLAVISYW